MDALARPSKPVRVLLDLRPALDKHAGIPQQTRLLFRGLSLTEGVCLEGLIQSSTHTLARGLPTDGRTFFGPLPHHRQIDRLGRVVIMLEQKFLRSHVSWVPMLFRRLIGGAEALTRFDATRFRDFIWRRLFARSLPPTDFNVVTSAGFRIATVPWWSMHTGAMLTKYLGHAIFPRIDTNSIDIMISETPYPGIVAKGTRLVVRYHDAIPLLLPHTISDRLYHQGAHYRALRSNVDSGADFVCVSEATRKDLLSIFPEVEGRSTTIHNIISHDYFDEPSSPSRVHEIVRTRLNPRVAKTVDSAFKGTLSATGNSVQICEYLLMVSTIEPRKNHLALLSAWERVRTEYFPDLRLVLVGSLGWHQQTIVRKFLPWLHRGELCMLEDVPSSELRLLYKHARATICPSFAEGFDLSGVEAMASGGVVVASDIPVHREIYADGAEYFNPYSVHELVAAIASVVRPEVTARRAALIECGARVALRYSCEAILPKWRNFLAAKLKVLA